MKKPMITGHAGCDGTPADSLESVEAARILGADAAEVDVRRAPDGHLYISHDAKSGDDIARMPSLEAVFRLIRDSELKINCDIKEPFAVAGVLSLAQKYGLGPDRLILTGAVSPEILAMEPAVTQNAGVYLNVEEGLKFVYMSALFFHSREDLFPELMTRPKTMVMALLEEEERTASMLRMAKALGVVGINLNHRLLTPALARQIRQEGLQCSVWTPSNPDTLRHALAMEPDNITTRTVVQLLEILNHP